jgi:homoserine kinase
MLESSAMGSDRVTVRVPATSANLGSGFDCLGMALTLTAEVTLRLSEKGAKSSKEGIERLVLEGARSLYKAAGHRSPPGLAIGWEGDIPIGRGLGVSATARAAGLVAANELSGAGLPAEQLLALGAELEGHADNMAPALFGGLQVVVRTGEGYLHEEALLPEGLKLVLFVPDFVMPTRESRRLLPAKVSREDAVYNIGRAALLIAALSQGRLGALDEATQDRLHQPARGQLFPAMSAIMQEARQAGALAAYLSGGGSTIAALSTEHEEEIARAMSRAAGVHGHNGRTIVTEPSPEGATIHQ